MSSEFRALSSIPYWLSGSGIDSDVVISSTCSLSRNIENYPFPDRASLVEKREIYNLISSALSHNHIASVKNFIQYNFEKIEYLTKYLLIESRAVDSNNLTAVGDRGVFVDKKQSSSVGINGLNHLQIRKSVPGFNPKNSWRWVDKCDNELGELLNYSFDANKGYLTANVSIAGNGLQVEFLVYLPALVLTDTIEQTLSGASLMGVSTQGLFGDNGEVPGSLFQMVYIAPLGLSEKEAISEVSEVLSKVIEAEREARGSLLKDAKFEIMDKIYRSYGILKYAKRLRFQEMLNLVSAIRFASIVGILPSEDMGYFNSVIINNMPGRLELQEGNKLSTAEQEISRSENIRTWLKKFNDSFGE